MVIFSILDTVTNQLVEVDLDSSSDQIVKHSSDYAAQLLLRLCSTVVTQIMQHNCYYLLAALDECYLLHKIGSNLLKLSDCLGFV